MALFHDDIQVVLQGLYKTTHRVSYRLQRSGLQQLRN